MGIKYTALDAGFDGTVIKITTGIRYVADGMSVQWLPKRGRVGMDLLLIRWLGDSLALKIFRVFQDGWRRTDQNIGAYGVKSKIRSNGSKCSTNRR